MDEERNELRGSLAPLSVAVIGLGTIGGPTARYLIVTRRGKRSRLSPSATPRGVLHARG